MTGGGGRGKAANTKSQCEGHKDDRQEDRRADKSRSQLTPKTRGQTASDSGGATRLQRDSRDTARQQAKWVSCGDFFV